MREWIKKLLGRSEHRLDDPVFGPLVYIGSHWEGSGYFAPAGERVEWFMEAGPDGPGEPQRRFFMRLQDNYDALLPEAVAAVLPHARQWTREDLDVAALQPKLKLSAFDLPPEEDEDVTWAIYFESDLRGSPHFVVQMRGWRPTGGVETSD